jgi:hypothetical protein
MSELFIVGAQRSGTTYLYSMLDQHPQVLMAKPVRPEPKFFINDEEYAKGKEYYESRYFSERSARHLYLGEKSTSYIESRRAAERISTYYPDASIMLMLRNPVTRAYSNYAFSVKHGVESLSFRESLDAEPGRIRQGEYTSSVNPYAYKQRGHYIDYIHEYERFFSRDQMIVLIYEEFVSDLDRVQALYGRLGIDHEFVPDGVSLPVNEGSGSIMDVSGWRDIVTELNKEFAESNARLESYLGRKIEAWREM